MLNGYGIILPGQPSRLEVREEYAKWLQSVFGSSEELTLGTYTFRNLDIPNYKPGRQRVERAARKLVDLSLANGMSVFVVAEEGTDTRRLHLHSLSNLERQRLEVIQEWWRRNYGHSNCKLAVSRLGVSQYVTKYVTKGDMPFWAGGPLFRTHNERSGGAAAP